MPTPAIPENLHARYLPPSTHPRRARIALLEIGAAAAADEQAIAGERHALVVQHVRHAPVRVAGGRADFDVAPAEHDTVAVADVAVRAGGAAFACRSA